MRTRYTDDEIAVRDAFLDFFTNESPPATVRSAAEGTGFDPALWAALAAMGAPGMALPESLGGAAAALTDLAVVVDVAGAHLAPVPLIEHAVAARAIARAGSHDDLVSELAAGSAIATLALRPPVDDTARVVPAGAIADVVLHHRHGQTALAHGGAPSAKLPNTADLPLAHRSVTDATPIDLDADGWAQTLDEWRALTAVAYVGLAKRAIEIGVAYAKERLQFGVLIGTFQAVQHGFADAATSVEGAHLLAQRAVWALETEQPGASRLASMALLFAAESARFATDRSVQYHGGYGFSEEYDIQLYHRHATAWILQLGDPAAEYARLADLEFGPVKGAA
ncbi:MAG: acyl-CoA dehydrogenase family protein [Actinomycetota bacterium]